MQAFLDAFARHDVDGAIALIHPQVAMTVHPFGLHKSGSDVLRTILAYVVRGFPDLVISVSRVISTGDVVTALFDELRVRCAEVGVGYGSVVRVPAYRLYSAKIVNDDFESGFTMNLGLKDLGLAAASQQTGRTLPLLDSVRVRMAEAVEVGMCDKDWSAIADYTLHR